MFKLTKDWENKIKNNRKFLTFSTIDHVLSKSKKVTRLNFPNIDQTIGIYTDYSGNYAHLAKIFLKDFAKIGKTHFEIINSKLSEQGKLKKLIVLWQPINDEISGYLFGDLSEENQKNWKGIKRK